MPKPKWNLNTIYISERLQESLRPISRCAMTTVVAPMGPIALRSSGKAYRRRLPARASSSCGNILAPRTQRAAD